MVSDRTLPNAGNALQQASVAGDERLMATASAALTQGYTSAFVAGAIMLLVAALVVATVVTTKRTQHA
jgi:hypothetical protein